MEIRYLTVCWAGEFKDILGRNAKRELREKVYEKILRFGVCSADPGIDCGSIQVRKKDFCEIFWKIFKKIIDT